jgi:mono/diheme cytochrome c family protein
VKYFLLVTAFAVFVFLLAMPPAVISQKSTSQAAANGRRIFNQSCAACHDTLGTTSKSGPELKSYYRRQPRPTDATMGTIIKQGKGKMPAFSTLNNSQVDDLVVYLKTL